MIQFLGNDKQQIVTDGNPNLRDHRQVRKITKTKGIFPTNDALYKLVYLAYRYIRKKWTMPLTNWGQTAQQLAIKFGEIQNYVTLRCRGLMVETRFKIVSRRPKLKPNGETA